MPSLLILFNNSQYCLLAYNYSHQHCSATNCSGKPLITGSVGEMKLLKACKSGFFGKDCITINSVGYKITSTGFVKDQFTTLPDVTDRLLCTNVHCKYFFTDGESGVDFNSVWLVIV